MTFYNGSPVRRNFGAPLTRYRARSDITPTLSNEAWKEVMREVHMSGPIQFNVSSGLSVLFWCHDRDEYREFQSKCNRGLNAIKTEYKEAYEEEERKRKEEWKKEKAKAARERGE